MDVTSQTLLERLRGKPGPDDWAKLVELYRPFIRRFVRLDAALSHDADDICQEVLRKVVEHLPQFERQRSGSFRAWLKTITVNELNLFWRRRAHEVRQVSADRSWLADQLENPQSDLSRRWDQEHASHVLSQLQSQIAAEFSASSWEAFRLRVLEQRSTQEVALELGISKNAVDIAKSRILSRLRAEAAELLDD